MSKYIEAERLRKELQKPKNELKVGNYYFDNSEQAVGYENALNDFELLIDSLQQEPLIHTELCTLIACDIIQATAKRAIEKPQDKDKEEDLMIKKMDYLNMLENGFSKQKLPDVNLEKEVEKYLLDNADFVTKSTSNEMVNALACHFAEWGARHSINWGDVQLLDTFILELSREEKDGTDWGDSEKFYTEVLRRFHEFNDKKISEIVAEYGKAHARKEE